MKVLKEYLVVVYNYDETRLGAYTLYGDSYDTVHDMAFARLNDNEKSFSLVYKGDTTFEDWMLV